MVFLLVGMMAFSLAITTTATEVVAMTNTTAPIIVTAEQDISPFHEFTQIYWRWHNGHLQMRVWSITNGRWLTDWIYA